MLFGTCSNIIYCLVSTFDSASRHCSSSGFISSSLSKTGLSMVKILLNLQGPAKIIWSTERMVTPLKHVLLNANKSILKLSHLFRANVVIGIRACNGLATISLAPSWNINLRLTFQASVSAISMCRCQPGVKKSWKTKNY